MTFYYILRKQTPLVSILWPQTERCLADQILILDVGLYSQAFYWTIIETNVGVLSACLPTLRLLQERYPLKPLFSRIKTSVTNLLSSSGRTSGIRIGSEEDELASGDNRRLHNETEEVTPHPSNSNSDLRGYQTQAGLNKDTFRSVRLT